MAGNDKSRKTASEKPQGERTESTEQSTDRQSPVPGQGAISSSKPVEGERRDDKAQQNTALDQQHKRVLKNEGLSTQDPAEGNRTDVEKDLDDKE